MLKKYSIACADGNRVGVAEVDMTGAHAEIKHGTVAANNRLRHVKLFKAMPGFEYEDGVRAARAQHEGTDPKAFARLAGTEQMRLGGLALEAQREFEATHKRATNRGGSTLVSDHASVAAADRVPCYFLPWNGAGAVVQLTIPTLSATATADTHPPVFLTAALSGCSVFVTGTPQNPTIFHCGKDGETGGDNATEFWTGAMRQILGDAAVGGARSAHNRDYMVPNRGASGSGARIRDAATTAISAHYRNEYTVEESRAWGAVFGLRTDTDWAFYLQENVTITYRKLLPPTGFFRKFKSQKPDPQARNVSLPIMVRRIFPDGGGAAQMMTRLRTLRY